MDVKTGVKLSDFSNYKTGGLADYFIVVKSADDIKQALLFAKEKNLKFFILAGGTNVLFPDGGFRGLVIKIGIGDFKIDSTKITAGAGVLVSDLVKTSIDNELTGLDWAGGLPGTIGGAVRGNAGCFGGEMKDSVYEVTAIDPVRNSPPPKGPSGAQSAGPVRKNGKGHMPQSYSLRSDRDNTLSNGAGVVSDGVDMDGGIKKFSNSECNFGYRDSRFKKEKFIITEVVFNLRKELPKEKLAEAVRDHINYRNEHQPLNYPNCGSVFKNVPAERAPESVRDKFRSVMKTDPFPVIPTAALIHEAGLKGYTIGGAKISEKHPNFIINFNGAKSKDISDLISFVRKEIKSKFEIDLDTEVEIVYQ